MNPSASIAEFVLVKIRVILLEHVSQRIYCPHPCGRVHIVVDYLAHYLSDFLVIFPSHYFPCSVGLIPYNYHYSAKQARCQVKTQQIFVTLDTLSGNPNKPQHSKTC